MSKKLRVQYQNWADLLRVQSEGVSDKTSLQYKNLIAMAKAAEAKAKA